MDVVSSAHKVSILDSFNNKNVLILGTTGFLGKVLFAMMMEKVPTFNCIYLLMRDKNETTLINRFTQEILLSPIFEPMRKKNPDSFENLIKSKVKVVHGDATLANLGLKKESYDFLTKNIDLVINSAGLVDFFPEVDRGFCVNTLGAINVAEFTKNCIDAKLIHISTCYVAPKNDGKYKEELHLVKSHTGISLDVNEEISDLQSKIKEIKNKNLPEKEEVQAQIDLGKAKALFWGFNNTYCYTKGLAEAALLKNYSDLSLTIIRPSIIESALSFPMAGWNEGFNTTSPLCYLAGGWYPYFVCQNQIILDIIPVDVVCKNILLIASSLMSHNADKIYQLSTSDANPLKMEQVLYFSREWHRKNNIDVMDSKISHYLRTVKKRLAIKKSHFLAPHNLSQNLEKVSKFIDNAVPIKTLSSKVNGPINKCSKLLSKIAKLHQVFQPFINDHQFIFTSRAINKLQPLESEFQSNIEELNWTHYWLKIHLPGLGKWIFPHYKAKTYKQKTYSKELLNINLDSVVLKLADKQHEHA